MKKDNRNKYKLDYAGHLFFILKKLEYIDELLSDKSKNKQFKIENRQVI